MIGETIKWRIRIVTKTGGITLGIGLKSFLKNINFQIEDSDYNKHGCYLVGSSGYSFTYMDK